jgi:hypothetical protein
MDKKLLDALSNLSLALEDIASALKDKSEAQSATAKAMKGGDFISEIKEINVGVKALQKDTKQILANQQTIMKMAETKGKESKTDDVEKLGKDKKSQSAFKEGIGVILLIAVAVLALGVAFNLVGKVNFLSVIALALALPLLAIGFSKVLTTLKAVGFDAKQDGKNFLIAIGVIALSISMASWILQMIIPISFTKAMTATFIAITFALLAPSMRSFMLAFKGLTWMEIAKAAVSMVLILPAMALGIAFASWAFQLVRPIGIAQFLTAVGISIAFVVISYGLRKILKSFKGMDMATIAKSVLFLPLVLPAVALGIALSSYALQLVKPVGFVQMLTAIGISIAFTVIAYGLNKMLSAFKGISASQAIEAAIMLPILFVAISYAMAYSSVAFAKIVPITFIQFLTAVGIAAVFVVISFGLKLMTKAIAELKWRDVLLLPALFTVMSVAITISSFILSKATPIPFGQLMSILGFSIVASASIVIIGAAIWALNKMGLSVTNAIKGGIAAVILSAAIMASSLLLNLGTYKNYPNYKWAIGVALSLGAFGLGAVLLGTQALNPFFYAGLGVILAVAGTIVATSYILGVGDYKKYPSLGWALGVGLSLSGFGVGAVLLGTQALNPFFYAGLGVILTVAGTIVATSYIFAAGKFDTGNFPSVGWMLGATGIILTMGLIAVTLGVLSPLIVIGAIAIAAVVGIIYLVDKVFQRGAFKRYPSNDWMTNSISTIRRAGDLAVDLSVKLPLIILGAVSMAAIAGSILAVDEIFNMGRFSKFPSRTWVNGTTAALTGWSRLMDSISFGTVAGEGIADFFGGGLPDVAESIVKVAKIFSSAGDIWNNYPSVDWMRGISSALTGFSSLSSRVESASDEGILKVSKGVIKTAGAYNLLARAIKNFSNSINSLDVVKVNAFRSLTGNLAILSAMDSNMFSNMLKVIETRSGVFANLLKSQTGEITKRQGVSVSSGGRGEAREKKDDPTKYLKDAKGETQLQKLDKVVALLSEMRTYAMNIDDHLHNRKRPNINLGSSE